MNKVDAKTDVKNMKRNRIVSLNRGVGGIFLLISVLCSLILPIKANAGSNREIRIGLYFKDESKKINSEISIFNISAGKGLEIYYCKDGNFDKLADITDNTTLIVRKDSYFARKGNSLTEYVPNKGNTDNGSKGYEIGPYHIRIGSGYQDYESAAQASEQLADKGVKAYPAYEDGAWYVFTGFYADEGTANADLSNTIINTLGEGDYQIVVPEPNKKGIVLSTGTDDNVIGMVFCSNEYIQIRPSEENDPYIFNINGSNYRGYIEVRRLNGSDMTVINVLPVEQYLYGVVPCEMGADSPYEALKAQAIVARTYTYDNLGKYSLLGFDLCNTVLSQVYKGYDYEKAATNKAVDETRDEIVAYNGSVASVFYFSSSGGRTEAVRNVWSADIPYLQSVEDKYEEGNSRYYNWEISFTAAEINNIMAPWKDKLGEVLGIAITKTSEAGRAIEMIVTGTNGEVKFERSKCREVFGLPSQWFSIVTDGGVTVLSTVNSNELKSTVKLSGQNVITASGLSTLTAGKSISVLGEGGQKKEISLASGTYTFVGRGYGHAVGMSQEGAKGMAKAGFDYKEILCHYFTGAYVSNISEILK